ncbi:unnamed protein product [Hydatigera taeniaeformis]|uniref:Uncharacterized protein n=1 Tax=Hydatigena taeniaeformis TaxID=6205 RepID=A0A0R3WP49_HYDTA|nr:unnamed protein product [Hydatigera taeniaeformis]
MAFSDTPHEISPILSSAKGAELPRNISSPKTKARCDHPESDHESLMLHINRRSSLATVTSTASDIPVMEMDFSSFPRRNSEHRTIGLRTKKYLLPRLLSHRKFALTVLHPSSAAVMNDIHYLLKVSIAPRALPCTDPSVKGSLSAVLYLDLHI